MDKDGAVGEYADCKIAVTPSTDSSDRCYHAVTSDAGPHANVFGTSGANFYIRTCAYPLKSDHQSFIQVVIYGHRTRGHLIWTTVLLVWVLALVLICDMEYFGSLRLPYPSVKNPSTNKEIPVPAEVQVVVFYEALCPDSRDFLVRELTPTFKDMSDFIALSLVPYGKAETKILKDGTKQFKCQHGETECQANIVHACVSKHVKDMHKSLDIISCMIDINILDKQPLQVGKQCVSKYKENWVVVEKCSSGDEGKEILYHMGLMTHDLNPPATFIPTITINGNRNNQQLILRDFRKAICISYTGPNIPEGCQAV